MQVRCPQCHSPIDLVDDSPLSAINCPSCGGSFSLLGEETIAYQAPQVKTIGHFDLVDQIGVGSFGAVWKARDAELDRTVAVKIPRKGQLDPAETEQFLREARAAAQLKHPNIVSVYEVGREEDTVYIVSDYVQGLTLADWLSDQRMTPREAAELCAKIADALHHAHEAGVIHRDLKPANVILDASGEPHIMDFGLARREAGEVTVTIEGKVLGTPAYISPEQAKGEAHEADRRSDVYSLGVILFELLTGERPFRGNVRMMLHHVIHDDAPSPRRFNSNIPRDLETICLKCLEKDPGRRYDSAKELAEELRRFLGGEPIRARPITAAGRAWRWCKRNPVVSSLAAGLVVALVGGLAGVTCEWIRAENHAAEARTQRQRAEKNFQKAMESVDQMLTRVGQERLAHVPQMGQIRRELLEDALKLYQQFLQEKSDDAAVQAETGRAYGRVGYVNRMLGQYPEAEEAYWHAIAISRRLGRTFPEEPKYRADLAASYHGVGVLFNDAGRAKEAEEVTCQAIMLREHLAVEFADVAQYRKDLADSYNLLGNVLRNPRPEDAEKAYRKTIELREQLAAEHPEVPEYRSGLAFGNLGNILRRTGRREEAEQVYRSVIELRENLVAEFPGVPMYRQNLAMNYNSLGLVLKDTGRDEDAEQAYCKAIELKERLVRDFPGVVKYRQELARNYNNLGILLRGMKRRDEAVQAYQRLAELRQKLADDFRDEPQYREHLAADYYTLGYLLQQMGRLDEAEQACRKTIELRKKLADDFAEEPDYRHSLSAGYHRLGHFLQEAGKHTEAEDAFQNAVATCQKLASEFPQEPKYCSDSAAYHNCLAVLLGSMGKHTQAEEALRHATVIYENLVTELGDLPEYRRDLANSCNSLASLLATCPNTELRDPEQAVELAKKAVAAGPGKGAYWNTLGVAQYRVGDWEAAIEALNKSNELLKGNQFSFNGFFLAMAHWQQGNNEEARKWYDRAVDWMEDNEPNNEELARLCREAATLLGISDDKSPD